MLLLHNLQDQVAQMSDKSETLKLIKNVIGQHLKDMKLEEKVRQSLIDAFWSWLKYSVLIMQIISNWTSAFFFCYRINW